MQEYESLCVYQFLCLVVLSILKEIIDILACKRILHIFYACQFFDLQ